MPNSGITVQSTTVTNANQIQAQVIIAPNASLGARGVILTVGKTRLTASNTFTVVSGASLAHIVPMQILRVVPNQIAAGSQNVDLTLQGTNFVPGTSGHVHGGRGSTCGRYCQWPGPLRQQHRDPRNRERVDPRRCPAGAISTCKARPTSDVVGKGMLNVLAAKQSGLPTVLKIPPITLQNFPLGMYQVWMRRWEPARRAINM